MPKTLRRSISAAQRRRLAWKKIKKKHEYKSIEKKPRYDKYKLFRSLDQRGKREYKFMANILMQFATKDVICNIIIGFSGIAYFCRHCSKLISKDRTMCRKCEYKDKKRKDSLKLRPELTQYDENGILIKEESLTRAMRQKWLKNKQNNIVSRQLEQDRRKFDSVKKILFLGSGGSGKSTIFKQLRGIYGKPFNASERRVFVSHIHEQCLTQMKLALEILEEYKNLNGELDGILHKNESAYIDRYRHSQASAEDEMSSEDEEDSEIPELSNKALDAAEYINNLHATFGYKLNDEIVTALKCLWQGPIITKINALNTLTLTRLSCMASK